MKMSLTQHGETMHAHLRENLDIQDIQDSKDSFVDLLKTNEQIVFDLSAIEEIDTAGIQLMLLIKRESVKQGKPCTFVNPSDSVKEALDLLFLSELCSESSR